MPPSGLKLGEIPQFRHIGIVETRRDLLQGTVVQVEIRELGRRLRIRGLAVKNDFLSQVYVGSQPGNMVIVVVLIGIGKRAKLARGNSARSAVVDGYSKQ